jgi:rubrerythrin
VLAAAAVTAGAGLTGCRLHDTPARPHPDAAALAQALGAEEELLARYDAALAVARTPAARTRLAAIRADHRAHQQALLAVGATRPPGPTPTETPVSGAEALVAAESLAARERSGSAIAAPSHLAPLLASIAASEATHVVLLRS